MGECPTLHVVPAETSQGIETMPIGVGLKRQHRVFISHGLLNNGIRSEELKALFARELSHLIMGHWHVPSIWTLLQASGLYRALDKTLSQLPPEIDQTLKIGWSQLQELCRAHTAAVLVARSMQQLPELLEVVPPVATSWLQLEADYGDILAEACELLEAPGSASLRAQALWALTVRARARLRTVRLHSFDDTSSISLATGKLLAAPLMQALNRAPFWVRDPRNLRLLGATSRGAARLARRPVLLLALAVKRASELAADRAAALALGGIGPVVAGLVRIHGPTEELRLLER